MEQYATSNIEPAIAAMRPDIKAIASLAMMERGCVHVIGLEALRDRAGVRWPKIRDGIYGRLEMILRQRLGPADFFLPLNDVAYLVTMPAAEPEDAQCACLRVAYELYTSYLGQCDLASITLYRAGHSETHTDAMVLDQIEPERLKSLAERAGTFEASAKPQAAAADSASRSARPAEQRQLTEFTSHFIPMWDARNEAISLYFCKPKKLSFLHASSAAVALHDLTPKERAKVELSCLLAGAGVLGRHLERGHRFLMGFRIAFETLSSHSLRVEFTSTCRELPSDYRQYLMFELTDVPDGVPHSRLAELVMGIKPYCKAVMAEIPSGSRGHASYHNIGLQAIGINLERPRLPAKETADEVAKLSLAAKRISLATFLRNVADLAALRAARLGGVQFMSGPAVARSLAEPRPMMRLHWQEVVQNASRPDQGGDQDGPVATDTANAFAGD